jgi:phosphate transport system substrate-binding protein
MRLRFITIVAAVLCAAASAASAEEIRVGGGAAPIENIFRRIKQPFEAATGLQLSLRADGPDKAMVDLNAGRLDLAAAGLSYKDLLDLVKKGGTDLGSGAEFKPRVIGVDKIQALTHKDLAPVKSLTKEQLKGLFSGQVGNWKQVGGPDLPVVVVFSTKTPGTNKLWQERIMDGADWAAARKEAGDASQLRKMVAATPGSIGIGPLAAEQGGGIHSPATPEVARPITAVTKGAPSPAVQKLLDYIQGEGQQFVAK